MRAVYFVEDADGGLMQVFDRESAAQEFAQECRDRLVGPERAWSESGMQFGDRVQEAWKEARRRADAITVRAVQIHVRSGCDDGHCGVCSSCRGSDRDSFRVWTRRTGRGRTVFKT